MALGLGQQKYVTEAHIMAEKKQRKRQEGTRGKTLFKGMS
jgi:hypothetical protein